jgi:phosphate/sulfate permease
VKFPNPWVGIPALIAGVGGGIIGHTVTAASCAPDSCSTTAIVVAVVGAAVTAVGVAVIAALALRSLAEHRDALDRDVVTYAPDDPPINGGC